jgi:glycosyltransferase involved in cell wall biosynthesis
LFDARGRWIDERREAGRWFKNPMVATGAHGAESALYSRARAIVTLTALHAEDVLAGEFGAYSGAPVEVITTCADYRDFSLAHRGGSLLESVAPEAAQRLRGRMVIGLVGSNNASYRNPDAIRLANHILAANPRAYLVILTRQQTEFGNLVDQAGLPRDRVLITEASHGDMPSWLSAMHWSIQVLNTSVAKRGSMPTKLAEFFAAGVRPIHYGCNEEVSDWVRRAGSGIVLDSLDDGEFKRVAAAIASSPTELALLERARENTADHFDLDSGIERYARLLTAIHQAPR